MQARQFLAHRTGRRSGPETGVGDQRFPGMFRHDQRLFAGQSVCARLGDVHGNAGGPPIVVGVDGSEQALRVVTWGAKQAVRRNAPLILVHAFAFPDGPGSVPRPDWRAAQERESIKLLREAMAVAEQERPRPDVTIESVMDSSIPLLLARSHTARMVVVGSRGRGTFADLAVGSTAIALAGHGHCPVAVIRGSEDTGRAGKPVVVGVDGSPLAEPAIELAFQEASTRGVSLVAVHAWHDFDLAETFGIEMEPAEYEGRRQGAERVLAESLAGWQEKYPEVAVERSLAVDRPRDRLLSWSKTAQLLVVGSRGRGGFRGLLLGSTTHALIHHADCPVLIARSSLPPARL